MASEKELLQGLLTQAYGLDEKGVASLYNEDGSELLPNAEELLLNIDRERVAKLKPDERKIRDEAYGRATKEVLGDFEKKLKAKYGIDIDKQGVELVDALVEKYRNDGGGGDLTDEQVKKSKAFLDYVEESTKQTQSIKDEYETKITQLKAEFEEKESWYPLKDHALSILEGMKPILPDTPEKALRWREMFLNEVRGLKRTIRDGKPVLLDADGNDLQDGHGNRISFDKKVQEIATGLFEFQKGEGRSTPPGGGGGGGPQKFTFASEQDYMNQRSKTTDPETLKEMARSFIEQKKSGAF